MPGGVPSAGVTMDERIRNLMRERGHEHLLMSVDEPELGDKIVTALRALDAEADEIREAMGSTVARNLQLMARMGVYFEEQVARRFPEFPLRTGVLGWEEYLPPLSPLLRNLLEAHSGVLPRDVSGSHLCDRLEARSNEICASRNSRRPICLRHGRELLSLVGQARQFFQVRRLKKGDRCALLAPNSIRWVALDLALMAEGIIVVPLYTQAVAGRTRGHDEGLRLRRVLFATDALSQLKFAKSCPRRSRCIPFDAVFAQADSASARSPLRSADSDPVTIIYTSGTSGEPKGVVLNAGTSTHMLGCTNERLDQLMAGQQRTRKCVSLHSVLLCGFLDRDAHLSFAQQRADAFDRPHEAFRRIEAGLAAIIS